MRYAVYKALDKKNSLFGIRGSYQKYAMYGLGASVFAGLAVGTTVNSLLGTILGIILAAGTYVGVLAVQSRYSEKERTKWFCAQKLPGYVLVPPKRLSKYVRYYISERSETRRRSQKAQAGSIDLESVLKMMDEKASRAAERTKAEEE